MAQFRVQLLIFLVQQVSSWSLGFGAGNPGMCGGVPTGIPAAFSDTAASFQSFNQTCVANVALITDSPSSNVSGMIPNPFAHTSMA